MSLIFTFSPRAPSPHYKVSKLKPQRSSSSNPTFAISLCRLPWGNCFVPKSVSSVPTNLKFNIREKMSTTCEAVGGENTLDFDFRGQERGDTEDLESPWVGAIMYKRNPSITHVEYCTTLERLGLANFSTEISRSRASVMGLRVTKSVKDYPLGTPVQISIDVIRKKQKLRLDGIIRTVLTLACNRCGEPAADSVFSNFSLLLTEEPIQEPEIINMGVIFGEGKNKSFAGAGEGDEGEDDEASIDLDDRLYFPREEKEIDISKNIRDLVHVEITINAVCGPMCKGICLRCGTNLNTSGCSCEKQQVEEKVFGPLGNLRRQMQQSKC